MADDRKKEDVLEIGAEVGRLMRSGAVVEVDPEDADALGAVVETAIGVEDALDSRFDETAEEGGR